MSTRAFFRKGKTQLALKLPNKAAFEYDFKGYRTEDGWSVQKDSPACYTLIYTDKGVVAVHTTTLLAAKGG